MLGRKNLMHCQTPAKVKAGFSNRAATMGPIVYIGFVLLFPVLAMSLMPPRVVSAQTDLNLP